MKGLEVGRRHRSIVVAGAAAAVMWTCGVACGLGHGAAFGYPERPPVPPGTAAVASATASDDDDPIRGREVVVDVGAVSSTEVARFYRSRFPSTAGWVDGTGEDGADSGLVLCRVRHADDAFDEYVEVERYDSGRSAGPHRFLVSRSRISWRSEWGDRTVDRCGEAGAWYPATL